MDPADAEADAGRTQPVRERHERRLSASRAITIPFSSMPSTNASRIASRVGDSAIASSRSRSSSSRLSMRKTARCPPESTGFRPRGTGPLRVRRRRRCCERRPREGRLREARARRATRRIASLCVSRCAVADADSRQAELLRDSGDDRDGAVGRDREHAVDPMRRATSSDRVNVREVDDLGDVGREQTWRLARSGRPRRREGRGARVLDRAPLMAPRADEEDGLHGAPMLTALRTRRWCAGCLRHAAWRQRARARGGSSARCGSRSSVLNVAQTRFPVDDARRRARPGGRRRSRCRRCPSGAAKTTVTRPG